MGDLTYQIRTSAVVCETIDGEVVAINLTHGRYYNMDGTAAQIWEAIQHRQSLGAIQAHLIATNEGAWEQICQAVTEFVDDLATEELIELAGEDAGADPAAVAPFSNGSGRRRFEPPVLRHLVIDPSRSAS